MVSRKSHILILSAALSTLTMAGGVAAVELAARGPNAQSAPAPAYDARRRSGRVRAGSR